MTDPTVILAAIDLAIRVAIVAAALFLAAAAVGAWLGRTGRVS